MQFKQKITPFLSFKDQASEAAEFYVSVFPDSKILQVLHNPLDGNVMTVEFDLAGLTFVALNVGQDWEFTNSVSLAVACESQDEIDRLWERLTRDGGKEIQCGWLSDKFGVPWQIAPANFGELIGDPDTERASRVMHAMMQMVKMDKGKLQAAYDEK